MKSKHQVPTSKHAVVILSEAKDLCYLLGAKSGNPEMFRFAQHDSTELGRRVVVRASLDGGIWRLVIKT